MSPMRTRFLMASLLLACGGCQRESDPYSVDLLPSLIPELPAVTDLRSVDLSGGPEERWELVPKDTLGGVGINREDTTVLFDRISDVRFLKGDRIAVSNAGMSEVLVFDDGSPAPAVTLGRPGDGPDEFSLIDAVRECGADGYYVMDTSKMRMKVFDTSGGLRDEYRVFGYHPNQPPWLWDCSDERVLSMQWGDGDPRVGPIGRFRIPVPLALAGPDGQVETSLGWVMGPERYRFENRGTGPAPLGAVVGIAMRARTVYVAEGPGLRVDAFSLEGEHLWTLSGEVEPVVAQGAAYVEAQRPAEQTADQRREFNARWLDWDFPEFLPFFRGFLVDDVGRIWMERYPNADDEVVHWFVLDPEGGFQARVHVPANTTLKHVAGGRAAAIITGPLDVERVVLFDIVKGEA